MPLVVSDTEAGPQGGRTRGRAPCHAVQCASKACHAVQCASKAAATSAGFWTTVQWFFTPKYRRGPFTDEILRRCEEVMRDVCTDFGAELREFNGERDHVHLLVHYPPKVAISRLVGSLKGVSARRLRQEFPGHIR
ncbi:IS200/IS605 family transposase, partial [Streptomyces avermitilis]|uniref:IS200/IS605 family transposase n=1 Tax=Streptomyces avermitilis TaxID=33903 RepID=UPI0033B7FE47